MDLGILVLRGLDRRQRTKGALLCAWFFVSVMTLWLLKPVRVASLLAHLGAAETPYVRLAGVVTVALVVMIYSAVVNRLSRLDVVRWSHLLFGVLLVAFWTAIRVGGEWLGSQRPFVWSVYILVEIYSVVLIGIFWTYTNDVVTQEESNKLYGFIGTGGILGGIAGGAFVDAFARSLGPINLLLVCAFLVAMSAGLSWWTEVVVRPPERRVRAEEPQEDGVRSALAGAREVRASPYLLLLVGIVIAYEFTATLTDFGISVVFERSFHSDAELAKMYGRLGWVVSVTALVTQVVVVPFLLPWKRAALLVPPLVMLMGTIGLLVFPVFAAALVLGASDRGLNYSIHQSVKETLYVPLTDAQKYKSKAFIDMFVDRAAKALAAFVLIAIIQSVGASVRASLLAGLVSLLVWAWSAFRLGSYWQGFRTGRPATSQRARSSGTRLDASPRAEAQVARLEQK